MRLFLGLFAATCVVSLITYPVTGGGFWWALVNAFLVSATYEMAMAKKGSP